VEESCVVDHITTLKCNTVVASSTKFAKAKKIVMTQSSHPVASSKKCASLPNRLGLSTGVSHPFFSQSSVGKKSKKLRESAMMSNSPPVQLKNPKRKKLLSNASDTIAKNLPTLESANWFSDNILGTHHY